MPMGNEPMSSPLEPRAARKTYTLLAVINALWMQLGVENGALNQSAILK